MHGRLRCQQVSCGKWKQLFVIREHVHTTCRIQRGSTRWKTCLDGDVVCAATKHSRQVRRIGSEVLGNERTRKERISLEFLLFSLLLLFFPSLSSSALSKLGTMSDQREIHVRMARFHQNDGRSIPAQQVKTDPPLAIIVSRPKEEKKNQEKRIVPLLLCYSLCKRVCGPLNNAYPSCFIFAIDMMAFTRVFCCLPSFFVFSA